MRFFSFSKTSMIIPKTLIKHLIYSPHHRFMSLATTVAGSQSLVTPRTVLDFWFGATEEERLQPKKFWFSSNPELDQQIKEKFGPVLNELAAHGGEYGSWQDGDEVRKWLDHPEGRLASIICLDQFSRMIHRGNPLAFAFDALAARLSLEGIEKELDLKLTASPFHRAFFYMPLQHAESLEMQKKSVEVFARLANDEGLRKAFPQAEKVLQGFSGFAVKHKEVIEKFGRFPMRNATLQRQNTPEEDEYAKLNKHF